MNTAAGPTRPSEGPLRFAGPVSGASQLLSRCPLAQLPRLAGAIFPKIHRMYLATRTALKGPRRPLLQVDCRDVMPYRVFLPFAEQAKGPPASPGQELANPVASDTHTSVEENRAEPPNLSSHRASATTETCAWRGTCGCCGDRRCYSGRESSWE